MSESHLFRSKTDETLERAKRKILDAIASDTHHSERVLRLAVAYAVLNETAPQITIAVKPVV